MKHMLCYRLFLYGQAYSEIFWDHGTDEFLRYWWSFEGTYWDNPLVYFGQKSDSKRQPVLTYRVKATMFSSIVL